MAEEGDGVHDGCYYQPVEASKAGFVHDEFDAFPATAFVVVVASLAAFPGLEDFVADLLRFGVAHVVFGGEELKPAKGSEVVVERVGRRGVEGVEVEVFEKGEVGLSVAVKMCDCVCGGLG